MRKVSCKGATTEDCSCRRETRHSTTSKQSSGLFYTFSTDETQNSEVQCSEYGFTVYEMGVVHAWVGQVVNMCISNVSRVSSP